MALTDLSKDTSRLVLRDGFSDVSPDELFGYWTTPALLCAWWPQVAQVEPQVGGAYNLLWPSAGWRLGGVYTTFEAGRRLGFTWRWEQESEAPETEVEITFDATEDGGATLTLTHGSYDDSVGSQEMRAGHLAGWTHFLGKLHAAL